MISNIVRNYVYLWYQIYVLILVSIIFDDAEQFIVLVIAVVDEDFNVTYLDAQNC
jgi:hypothetical protein